MNFSYKLEELKQKRFRRNPEGARGKLWES